MRDYHMVLGKREGGIFCRHNGCQYNGCQFQLGDTLKFTQFGIIIYYADEYSPTTSTNLVVIYACFLLKI